METLGGYYFKGKAGVVLDKAEGILLCRIRKNADAAYKLGRCYIKEDGVEHDERNALQCLFIVSQLSSEELKHIMAWGVSVNGQWRDRGSNA